MNVDIEREGHVERKRLQMGSLPVRLPERPNVELWLVVIRGLATHPVMFVSVILGTRSKLNLIFKKVCQKAKRFYEIAAFYHYAVADGIHRLLFASRTGPHPPRPRVRPANSSSIYSNHTPRMDWGNSSSDDSMHRVLTYDIYCAIGHCT